MEVPSCPRYSLGIPRVILGEPVDLPVHHNPGKEAVQSTVIILPPAVENYNPKGELSVPLEAVGSRLNLLI